MGAYEAGITTIDTAGVCGERHSEQIIAEALSDVRVDALKINYFKAKTLNVPNKR